MNKPWYKHFWVWFVIAPPAAAIIAGLSLLAIAINNADDLVVDDYRKIGRTFEQQTERDRAAAALGVTATLSIDRDDGSVNLRLELEGAAPTSLVLSAVHPTVADRDLVATLALGGDGIYRGNFAAAVDGRRYLQLEPEDRSWRLTGVIEAGGPNPVGAAL
ncbi:MAG: FixH family protein [Xanthomonadaceae bacterium]|nr:FixH family protein [Xanthomonadaceae bacterium]